MSQVKAEQSLKNFAKALERLSEALDVPTPNTLMIDGTIQRFEFVCELFWKTLKRVLELNGIESHSPRDAMKKGFAVDWLENESLWLGMLKDRNETSHVYDEEKANEIYGRIKTYFLELQKVKQTLEHYAKSAK